MSRSTPASSAPETAPPPQLRIARQAILDTRLEVHGYELLYRGERGPARAGNAMTASTILDAFVEIGIERLTGGRPAFLNLTGDFFTAMPPIPFPPETVVLEILEDTPVDGALIEAVRALRGQGYRIALDDYLFERHWDALLPLVSLVKVEINEQTLADMPRLLEPLRRPGLQLLAEKVETREQYRRLADCGFTLFQGYFFARPEELAAPRIEESGAVVMRLIARLNDPEVDIREIADLIARDPALGFKMLRLINSPAVGLRRQVDSIQQAVVLLGLDRIRAWATLFVMARMPGAPRELLRLGMLRAALCERLARLTGTLRPETAGTVGLLSILDGLFSAPMPQVLEHLPLPDSLRQALCEGSGEPGRLLRAAMALERGDPLPQDAPETLRAQDLGALVLEAIDEARLADAA